MSIQSVNPATGDVVETYEETSPKEIERILAGAQAAFAEWRNTPFTARARSMRNAAEMLKKRRTDFARLMTLEMGKPIVQAEAEVDKCAWTCEFFAEHAEGFLAEQPRETDASRSYVRFDPLGPVLAVMPWNFPFWQVFRFAAPALMAGNAAVLKHASNVPGCALAIEDLLLRAGFPKNLFRTLMIGNAAVEAVIAHRHVRAVTPTGSGTAGRAGRGKDYLAKVLTGVGKGMPAYDEGLFGPVAAIIPVHDENEAVAVDNDTAFGLGGAIITRDRERAERIAADQIEAGSVFVNEPVKSDPRLPFGGIKESGYGRELSGYGIKEFVNIKTVYVA